MKKAFTLIELIATIVILGVVTSIVSILVMNIIRSSKENANRRNIDEYGRIIETSMAEYQSQYLKYPDSIDQLEIEYVGSVIECEIRRINPDKTIYLSECKVNGKKVLDKSTEDGYYHYGILVLTNEEYVDKLGNNIELALKDYYEENNKYPINYRLLDLPTLDKDVNCVSEIHKDGTVYLTKCSIEGSYIMNESEEDGYYHYGKTIYDYFDKDGNGYVEVEYLESTGKEYINTEYYVKSNTRVEMNMQLIYTNKDQKFLGSYGGSGLCLGTFGSKWRFGGGTWNNNQGTVTLDKTYITIEGNTFTFNDQVYTLVGTNRISNNTSFPLLVFAIAYGGGVYQKDSIKLYDLKLYDNDNLVRDYIPVIDSSEKPCLFDKVDNKCYYNQGTGEFLYG